MTEDIKNKLLMCAEMYHRADFIQSDPVQFPHRYTLKQDIEVSGLLTAIMSFGNRKQILKKADDFIQKRWGRTGRTRKRSRISGWNRGCPIPGISG